MKHSILIERASMAVYDLLPYDEPGTKPEWVFQGNSLKQDEARRYAIAAIVQVRDTLSRDLEARPNTSDSEVPK